MRKLFFLATLILGFQHQISAQTEADWKNISADFCKGVNKASKNISTDTKDAVVFSGETGADLSEIFADLMSEDPDKFLKDVEAIEKMSDKIGKLSDKLDKKYEGVFDSVDETDMNMHYLSILKDQKGCGFARALIQVGMNQGMNDEPPIAE